MNCSKARKLSSARSDVVSGVSSGNTGAEGWSGSPDGYRRRARSPGCSGCWSAVGPVVLRADLCRVAEHGCRRGPPGVASQGNACAGENHSRRHPRQCPRRLRDVPMESGTTTHHFRCDLRLWDGDRMPGGAIVAGARRLYPRHCRQRIDHRLHPADGSFHTVDDGRTRRNPADHRGGGLRGGLRYRCVRRR